LADPAPPFARAALALDLLAVDPGLGGLRLVARAGPVRAALTARIGPGARRLHPALDDDALFGGLDLSATLASGHRVDSAGLLAEPAVLVLPMAERTPPGLAARLGACLDAGRGHLLIALDETAGDGEGLPAALSERLAFDIDLSEVPLRDATLPPPADIAAAKLRLAATDLPDTLPRQIAELTLAFGIDSPRAALFALRAARALASLRGGEIGPDEVETAAALTLAHRATQMPEPDPPPDDDAAAQQPPPPPSDSDNAGQDSGALPRELLVEAIAALLPPDLLEGGARADRRATGTGAGAMNKGNRRGRPLPSRPGRPGSGARIDLVATLRAAAPWQTIRAKTAHRPGLQIRGSDIRLRRYQHRSDRLIVFTVDASGSSALARLAEAKGAVEHLLARAYTRRDHVCLVAFRGTGAEVLLPPTRSLVQTKRRLAALPGGGATPLAAGLQSAAHEIDQARRKGMQPMLCLLTDGRANIALDGTADRARAAGDATRIARTLAGTEALVIDCGTRPTPALRDLAAACAGRYMALPRADAGRLSRAVSDALG